jgi:predicted ATP-grasp superfamily ATP-dependent carboligase
VPSDEIIVQNIIPGPSRNQFSACFLFLDGEPYVTLTANRMRQHPLDFGNATTYAETVNLPIIVEYALKILKASNYNGLCEVEFKKDETDGQYKFLEVNTRTWKWHAIAEKAGTPFLENYFRYLNGESIIPANLQKQASFLHTLTDFPVQLKLKLKGFNYAFRKKKPVVKAVWAWDDCKPWFYEKLYLISLIRNR